MELPITLLADHPLQLGNFTSAHLGTFKSALTAPFSRAPVKGAVRPTTPNRNPGGAGGNVRSGGGPNVNKYVKVQPVGGSPSTRKTNQGMAGQSGRSEGNHAMDKGTFQRNDPPLHTVAPMASRHGNEMAFTEAAKSGRACVGVGRVVHPSGAQSTYSGDNRQGVVNADRTIAPHGSGNAGRPLNRNPAPMSPQGGGGGPGSMGFRGGK
jgi:hypothetical protein